MKHTHTTGYALVLAGALLASAPVLAGDDTTARAEAARQATGQLIKQLGSALKQHMSQEGPEAAISVCRDLAPKISGEISRANGWRVTRVSSKVRNPMLGTPDAWERQVLADFEARAARGEAIKPMAYSEVVDEGGVRYFRFMKALGVKEVCLTCHGDKEIPAGVRARLASDYPMDRATGYRKGDLRGAVSIKQPMDISLPAAGAR